MLDCAIVGGTLIDGTGDPGRRADVGIRDGRIVELGSLSEPAERVIDAEGMMVCPGFIDPHTHYDAQLFWDPFANPSNVHGVTTVIAGNCGFSLAPIEARDADYIRRMMAQVEGMPLESLEVGLPWDWRTFEEYLARLDGRTGINVGFMVGHSAIRRAVMGVDAVGEQASPAQVQQMLGVLHDSLRAGGLGLSTSLAFTHMDGDGQPVPSRWSDRQAEVLPLARAVGQHEGTTLELIIDGCVARFSDEEVDLLTTMSVEAQRPLNWNLLQIDGHDRERYDHQRSASTRAAARGGRIVALTMPVITTGIMSFLTYCALQLLPGWKDVLRLPVPERIAKLRDPDTRRSMMDSAMLPEAGTLRRLAQWETYTIGDTFAEVNQGLKGRKVADIAAERGQTPSDCVFDIVVADELRTVLFPGPQNDNPESWTLRAEAWNEPDVLIGGSDAGAHLDRHCGQGYPTAFLRDCLHGRRLVRVERAVQLMTQAPARLFGLRGRGELLVGNHADVVVFDPATIGATDVFRVEDMPGGAWRLSCDSTGVEHVFVNGREAVLAGSSTGTIAGTVLRSGRDTYTVTPTS